jgi:hypothetical protein
MTNSNRIYNAQEVPFFARYLEAQITQDISEEEAKKISGGVSPLLTYKTPSDIDEVASRKYPSDDDEDYSAPF